jgi:hypothetical protein
VDDEIVHVDVAVPFAESVAEVQLTDRPVTEPATFTLPAKFCVLVNVRTSVVVVTPVLKLMSDEAALTVKSPTWTVIVTECEAVPVAAEAVNVRL